MESSANFSAALMSDAKWRKFFNVAAANSNLVFAATWKLIDDPKSEEGHLPEEDDIFEDAVDGCLNGPVEFKRIEWIEIPRRISFRRYENAPLSYRTQDLDAFLRALSVIGQFPLEQTEESVRIYGYRR